MCIRDRQKRNSEDKLLEKVTSAEYKYGFTTKIESDTIPKGLSEDVVRIISAKKNGQFEYQKKEISPGAVGWLESNDIGSWYDKGNEGIEEIEYILVTLK